MIKAAVPQVEKVLALIPTLSDREKLQTLHDNATVLGLTEVVAAAEARLAELFPPKTVVKVKSRAPAPKT
jgi:hypothetical protein